MHKSRNTPFCNFFSTISLLWLTLASAAVAAELPGYPKIAINPDRIMTLEQFPFTRYFSCLSEEQPDAAQFIDADPQFKHVLRQSAGQLAVELFRHLKMATPMQPQPLPSAPLSTAAAVHWGEQRLVQLPRPFHYQVQLHGLFRETLSAQKKRYWLWLEPLFFQRSADAGLHPISNDHHNRLLLSIEMRRIESAQTEQQAYQRIYESTQLYLNPMRSSQCPRPKQAE